MLTRNLKNKTKVKLTSFLASSQIRKQMKFHFDVLNFPAHRQQPKMLRRLAENLATR